MKGSATKNYILISEMCVWVILFMLIFSIHEVKAQVIFLKDSETKQPLEFATIYSKSPKAFTTTDASGKAEISKFKGSELIEIRILGYKTERFKYAELIGNEKTVWMQTSGISLDQVIVSATRSDLLKREVPVKIALLSRKEAQFQEPQTQADLLNITGNVYIQKSQQGGGSPMIRGFSANRLLYSVDGIRMNSAIFRGGNLHNIISLDPYNTMGAEVLMGPGSVMYGSDAIGGVINIKTLTPHFTTNERFKASGALAGRFSSANNENTGHMNLNLGWKKLAMRTSFTYNKFGDLSMGSNGPDDYLRPFYVTQNNGNDHVIENRDPEKQVPTAYTQYNLMHKVMYNPTDELSITYALHFSTTGNIPRYDRLIQLRENMPTSAEWYYGPQKWLMNAFTLSSTKNKLIYDRFTLRLAYQQFTESRNSRNFNNPFFYERIENVGAWSGNIDLEKTIDSKNRFFYGAEYVLNNVESKAKIKNIYTNAFAPYAPRYPASVWQSAALYASYQYNLTTKLSLLTGARYNIYSTQSTFDTDFYPLPFTEVATTNDAFTGNLGFVFNPTEKWIIRLNSATGFRAPNVDDMGKVFDSEPGAVVVPNKNLKAEYVYNFEVGIARIFSPFFEAELSAYYTFLNNAMVRRDFVLNGNDSIFYDGVLSKVQSIQNAAEARVYGIEAEFEAKMASGPGIWGRINFQKGVEEMDDGSLSPSRHAPPMFGTLHLTYQKKRLIFDVYTLFNGSKTFDQLSEEDKGKAYIYAKDENGNPWSPAWLTLNFKAMYKVTNGTTLNFGIENITDIRYKTYSSGIAAPGRNLIISIKANF